MFNKTKFFLWNAKYTDRNGVDKLRAHAHQILGDTYYWKELVSMKKIDTPRFLNQPPILWALPFYGKNLNPPSLFA